MTWRYLAFGLAIESDFPLPTLAGSPAPADRAADVRIVEGAVAPCPAGEEMPDLDMAAGMVGNRLVIAIDEVGRFGIEPDRITLDADPRAAPIEIASYLLGSALGGLLHRRRMLPFHSNAVLIDGRAYLFCGESGAGKSTLAAHFMQAGRTLLTDDICAIRATDDGGYEGLPGIPRVKLWQESIDLLALGDMPREHLPWTDDKFEIARTMPPLAPAPIAAIYHLLEAEDDEEDGIFRLGTLDALNTITSNIYRRRLADIAGERYFLQVAAGLAQGPVFAIKRRWGLDNFAAEAARITAHLAEVGSGRHAFAAVQQSR